MNGTCAINLLSRLLVLYVIGDVRAGVMLGPLGLAGILIETKAPDFPQSISRDLIKRQFPLRDYLRC